MKEKEIWEDLFSCCLLVGELSELMEFTKKSQFDCENRKGEFYMATKNTIPFWLAVAITAIASSYL